MQDFDVILDFFLQHGIYLGNYQQRQVGWIWFLYEDFVELMNLLDGWSYTIKWIEMFRADDSGFSFFPPDFYEKEAIDIISNRKRVQSFFKKLLTTNEIYFAPAFHDTNLTGAINTMYARMN